MSVTYKWSKWLLTWKNEIKTNWRNHYENNQCDQFNQYKNLLNLWKYNQSYKCDIEYNHIWTLPLSNLIQVHKEIRSINIIKVIKLIKLYKSNKLITMSNWTKVIFFWKYILLDQSDKNKNHQNKSDQYQIDQHFLGQFQVIKIKLITI